MSAQQSTLTPEAEALIRRLNSMAERDFARYPATAEAARKRRAQQEEEAKRDSAA